jgi:hypothetical protein
VQSAEGLSGTLMDGQHPHRMREAIGRAMDGMDGMDDMWKTRDMREDRGEMRVVLSVGEETCSLPHGAAQVPMGKGPLLAYQKC